MSNQNFKIRIKIQQPQPHAIEEICADPEISYQQSWDWNKIVIAIVLLLFLLWMIGSLFFSGEQQATPQQPQQPIDFLSSIPDTLPAATTDLDEQTLEAQPIVTPIPSDAKSIAPSKPIIVPTRKPIPKSIAKRHNITDKEIPKTVTHAKPHPISDNPYVLRAQLSRAVKAHEPIDDINSVSLQPGESKPIYFYMHLRNLRGQSIRINWYHNDKLDSQLILRVHNDNWRTQASKQLDHQRLGVWRVELIGETGNQLATKHFSVTQN